jgi:hypothetical protein
MVPTLSPEILRGIGTCHRRWISRQKVGEGIATQWMACRIGGVWLSAPVTTAN